MRLYGPAGTLALKRKAPGGARPHGTAFSPDGARLAVGYYDTTRVDVLDAATLAPLHAAETQGLAGGNLSSVAFLADGPGTGSGASRLAAGGQYQSLQGARWCCTILVWADGGRGARADWPGPDNTVMDLAALPHGALAFGSGDPAFGVLAPDGSRRCLRGPAMANMNTKLREHFIVSADGRRLRFGLQVASGTPVLFDLAGRTLTDSPKAPPDLTPADIAGLAVDGWEDGTEPALATDGGSPRDPTKKRLVLEQYEVSRSLAVAPDAASFVLGTEWSLRRFDAEGNEIWEKPVPGTVWGVNLARDGRLLLAAYDDGTIRWHRTKDGEELLALFIHLAKGPGGPRAWILWTPKGYYQASSAEAERLIGWHVNRGEGEAADFYPAETFAPAFKRPDMIDAALADV